jgi:hypothetical protein
MTITLSLSAQQQQQQASYEIQLLQQPSSKIVLFATMVRTRHQTEGEEEVTNVSEAGDDELGELEMMFIAIGSEILNQAVPSSKSAAFQTRWTSHFQVDPIVCAEAWRLMQITDVDGIVDNGRPEHLLWSLMFLTTYDSESVLARAMRVDEDTFRKWCWLYILKLSYLEFDVVSMLIVDFVVSSFLLFLTHCYNHRSIGTIALLMMLVMIALLM